MVNKSESIKVNHIIFVLDNSGSMGPLRSTTISNFNEQLEELKKNKQSNQVNLISLITFNGKVSIVKENCPLGKFDPFRLEEYVPAGFTSLHDAVGEAITIADRGFHKYIDMDNAALIVILSDGEENSSKEFNRSRIASLVKAKQDSGRFTFSFLGCGIETLSQAVLINIPQGNTQSWPYSSEGLTRVMNRNSNATTSFMSTRNVGGIATSGFYQHADVNDYLGK